MHLGLGHAMKQFGAIVFCVAATTMFSPTAQGAPASCESLRALRLPNATIDVAASVPAGNFSRPGAGGLPQTFNALPAFCRIAATLRPTAQSDIKIEVWLPMMWNGKFQAVGNGQWAGTISYGAMASALRAGYATTSTDTGHVGNTAQFAVNVEKLVDYSWRSEHEMTLKAKAIIAAFYGTPPRYSYWNGCSTGGRQGLKEVTLFPREFDGLVIGAPANYRAARNAWQMDIIASVNRNPAGTLSEAKLNLINRATLDACDILDGVEDGLLVNPKVCRFDPAALTCKGAENGTCLTSAQVTTARRILSPGKLRDGREYQPGPEISSVLGVYGNRPPGWATWAQLGSEPAPNDNFVYVVYKDPKWDWRNFQVTTALPLAEEANAIETAHAADLSTFLQGGGKIIFYHDWSDPSVAPQATINYFNEVQKVSARAAEATQLFLVPGMGHCTGGAGATDTFDAVAALDRWVTVQTPPQAIPASRVEGARVTRTRPLCPYPQVAKYDGTGSSDDAANFPAPHPDSSLRPAHPGRRSQHLPSLWSRFASFPAA